MAAKGVLCHLRDAQRELWKHMYCKAVKVVRGPCPAAEAVFGGSRMTTKQQVEALAKELGATVYSDLEDGGEILIDAPDGFYWGDGACHQMVFSPWWDDAPNGKRWPAGDLWKDALSRMKQGLEECPPDCCCRED